MAIKIKSKKNSIVNIESSLKSNENTIVNTESYDQVSMYFEDFYEPAKVKSFIKSCEKKIRNSDAYSNYIGNLRNEKGLHFCAIKGNITDEDASIEFHHYPFSLYDICYLELMRMGEQGEKITTFKLASNVIDLHANNLISLVPLCITEHQLVHDGVKFVPLTSCIGKINEFIDKYYDYLLDDHIEKYNKLVKYTEEYNNK